MSLVLLFTYDVIKIYWNPGMVFQISIGYQEAPRKWAPNEAIPVAGPGHPAGHHRGCEPGAGGRNFAPAWRNCSSSATARCATVRAARGTARSRNYWKPDMRKPANLTEPRIQTGSDASIYVTISKGFGTMPPLNENMNVRERWDTVNYVKTLGK